MTPASQVEVHVDGQSSGVAFLSTSPCGTELSVIGKLSFVLLEEGQAAIVARPEPPGFHRGVAAPAELDDGSAGLLLVSGPRLAGGRVVLRRGTNVLAEVAFHPGLEPFGVTATGLQVVTGPDAAAGEDEWLVIEGVTAPDGRRWCKLPKMRLVASWEPFTQLVLGSRACFVDLTTWTVSFLLRGTLPLATPAPRVITVLVEDTFISSVRERPAQPPETLPSPDTQQGDDDDEGVSTAVRAPAASVARVLEDAPTDEQKTRVIQIPVQMPPEALPESSTRRGGGRRGARGARAGLRLGPTDAARPAGAPLDEETTVVATLHETAPTSVTRAFAALSPDASAGTAARDTRAELLRRIRSGEPLGGLELRGAVLAGMAIAGASLAGIDLSSADLRGANLAGTDLRGARLDGAQLDGARLEGANFEGASLIGASLRSVALTGASFVGADLSNAQIGSTQPESAFAGAKLDALRRV